MDPPTSLGAATSVIAVIRITKERFSLCQNYYEEVRDCKKDVKLLRDEVISLQDILTDFKDLELSAGSDELSSLKLLNRPSGPLEECGAELKALVTKLHPGGSARDGNLKQFGLKALKWPLISKDVQSPLRRLREARICLF